MYILILAAGYATRLYPYTLNIPKPLLPINGKPLIDYIIDETAKLNNVKKTIVITNDKFCEQFNNWNKQKAASEIMILNDGTTSAEARLGAIGDIVFAINSEKIDDDLIVIAGDNLFTYDISEYYAYFKSIKKTCVCVKRHSNKEILKNLGICTLDENNKVIGFIEKPKNPPTDIGVYATYMFKKDALHFFKEFLKDGSNKDAPGYFIEWLHKKTDVYAYHMNGDCYDIGTVEAYEHICENFESIIK